MRDCYVEVFEVLLDVSHNGFANREVSWGLVYAYGEFFGLSRSLEVEVDSASVGVEFAWVGDGSSRFKDWGPDSVCFGGVEVAPLSRSSWMACVFQLVQALSGCFSLRHCWICSVALIQLVWWWGWLSGARSLSRLSGGVLLRLYP